MQSITTLRKRFETYRLCASIRDSLEITDAGLVLGAGTILMRMEKDALGHPALALTQDEERALALLSVAYGASAPRNVMQHLQSAADHWRRGDKALAQIRLSQARVPRITSEAAAWRVHIAAALLDEGFAPRWLLRELGLADLEKYDPDEPRVPAGSGRASGQWTSGARGAQTKPASSTRPVTSNGSAKPTNTSSKPSRSNETSPTRLWRPNTQSAASQPVASRAESAGGSVGAAAGAIRLTQFSQDLAAARSGGAFLTGLAELAGDVAAAGVAGVAGVVLNALFVTPAGNDVAEGSIPGDPGTRYSLNNDEGVLRFLQGNEVIAVAHRDLKGVFYDVETGIPVARAVGRSVVFDAQMLASISAEDESEDAGTHAQAEQDSATEKTEPQLCPDPGPDAPHGARALARGYQEYISVINNPQRPLSAGLGVSLINPLTGKRVVYDDCRVSDGTLIEAKGPGFARKLRDEHLREVLEERWIDQATRQVQASGGRPIAWYFDEPQAAAFAKKIFGAIELLKNIQVVAEPMPADLYRQLARQARKERQQWTEEKAARKAKEAMRPPRSR